MKKILMRMIMLLMLVSCGKEGTNGALTQSEQSGTSEVTAVNCSVKFYKKDSPSEIAKKAHRARVECNLNEEEVLFLVNRAQ